MQTTKLMEIMYHHDSDTGMAYVGEVDYCICGTTKEYLKNFKSGRKELAEMLRFLANAVEKDTSPIGKVGIGLPDGSCQGRD